MKHEPNAPKWKWNYYPRSMQVCNCIVAVSSLISFFFRRKTNETESQLKQQLSTKEVAINSLQLQLNTAKEELSILTTKVNSDSRTEGLAKQHLREELDSAKSQIRILTDRLSVEGKKHVDSAKIRDEQTRQKEESLVAEVHAERHAFTIEKEKMKNEFQKVHDETKREHASVVQALQSQYDELSTLKAAVQKFQAESDEKIQAQEQQIAILQEILAEKDLALREANNQLLDRNNSFELKIQELYVKHATLRTDVLAQPVSNSETGHQNQIHACKVSKKIRL